MTARIVEITQSFTFDAAHVMPHAGEEHPYGRMHGHSFVVEATLRGEPDPETGWIVDFAVFDAALKDVRGLLDHRLLNDVEGLDYPTLETLALWIAERLRATLPALAEVSVARPTIGQRARVRLDPA